MLAASGAVLIAALLAASAPAARTDSGAPGRAEGQLGLVGMDHVGITVPDIDQAITWFEDVMGCVAPLTFGPFGDPTGTFMQDLLDVHPRAVIQQITMVRCGRSANIELFEYTAPDQRTTFPRNSDWSGHHIAFYVTDLGAAAVRAAIAATPTTVSRASVERVTFGIGLPLSRQPGVTCQTSV